MTNNEIYNDFAQKEAENRKLIDQLENSVRDADYLTLRAEFANYKTEQQKIIDSSIEFGQEEVLAELVKFVKSYDELIKLDVSDEKFKTELDDFSKVIEKCISAIGLEEVDCTTTLDPNLHYAVMMDNNPELDDDQITEVLQKGYKLEDTLVRPAMVKVNKK